jgi:uncharacterized protein YjbI with pentapeptide repeats
MTLRRIERMKRMWRMKIRESGSLSSLLHQLSKRLQDQSLPPRSWWYPIRDRRSDKPEDQQKQHDDLSKTINRTYLSLIGTAFFCLVTLGGSDESLVGTGAKIDVPFAGVSINVVGFLTVGPIILISMTAFLHIFVEEWLKYSSISREKRAACLFNIDGPAASLLTYFIFYALCPLVLFWFVYKAQPHRERYLVFWPAMAFTLLLLFLAIRRCPAEKRRLNIINWLFFILCIIASIQVLRVGLLIRPLNLFEANLQGKNLEYSDLTGADLRRANLQDAKLTGAKLIRADLNQANLLRADMRGAELSYANFEGANFEQAILDGLRFTSANKIRGRFRKASVKYAEFYAQEMDGSDFSEADLEGARFEMISLKNASFRRAILKKVKFGQGVDLTGSDMNETVLLEIEFAENISLSNVHLETANLEKTISISQKQLDSACTARSTKLPPDRVLPQQQPRGCIGGIPSPPIGLKIQ